MPTLKKTTPPTAYYDLVRAAREKDETKDCAVKAIALATGAKYETVLEMLAAEGRKKKGGTHDRQTREVLRKLGYGMKKMPFIEMRKIIKGYPKPHCNAIKNITTYHPRRFPESFTERFTGKVILFFTKSHVACYRDSEMHDWSTNNRLHVTEIYEVKKI